MTGFRVADRDRFGWQDPVIDRHLLTPPGTPAEGDRYIVGSPASGGWAGHEYEIAEYDDSVWLFHDPAEGWRVDVRDEDIVYRFNGSIWVRVYGKAGTLGFLLIHLIY